MIYGNSNRIEFKKIIGYLLPVTITILFLYLAFLNVDLNKSFYLIAHASILWILIYIIVFYLSHLVRAFRWKIMIRSVKNDASILNLFGAVIIGYGVNCVVPRLGEIYRGLFIGRWEGISRTTMLGTIIVERIIDVSSFAIASVISIFLFSGNLLLEVVWLKNSLIIGFITVFFIVVLLFALVKYEEKFGAIVIRILSKLNKRLGEKLSEIISTLISGLSTIKGTRTFFLIIVQTLFILILYALNSYVGFFMLDMQNYGPVNFTIAWILMTISAFGIIVPTPGGTGSYHIISIFVLSQLFGFAYEISAAYALLTHFISYLVFIGSTFALIYFINKIRSKKGFKKENFISVFNLDSELK